MNLRTSLQSIQKINMIEDLLNNIIRKRKIDIYLVEWVSSMFVFHTFLRGVRKSGHSNTTGVLGKRNTILVEEIFAAKSYIIRIFYDNKDETKEIE